MLAGARFDLLIFDFDGTLCDTRLAIAHCLKRTLAKHGRLIPAPEHTASVVGKGLSLAETFLSLDPALREKTEVLAELIGTYRSLHRNEGDPLIEMVSGADETLQNIHARGIKCVVVSNKGTESIHRSLDRYGLAPFIDLVFGEEQDIPPKPDPRLLTDRIVPEFPQIPRSRMLMVGDTEIDIAFARAAGIACCWAAYGFGNRQRCAALAPEYHIDAIAELLAVVLWPNDRG
jgi:phosphoglycolate phosphatase